MESFSEVFKRNITEEKNIIPDGYKVELQASGESGTSGLDMGDGGMKPSDFQVIGWFSNKYNPAFGWTVFEPDKYDIKYLKESGISNLTGIKRVASDKGTSIVKFNLKKGTYGFAKDADADGNIKFEKMTKYRKFLIDHSKYLKGF